MSLVHVKIAELYSTDAFLMTLRRFMAIHGAPRQFQSDQGTQLVAAAGQVASWDWSKIRSLTDSKGVEWQTVPSGAQHFNGKAERLIGMVKYCLKLSMKNLRFSLGEMMTLVSEAAQIVNSRLIAARACQDATVGVLITPLDLQLVSRYTGPPKKKVLLLSAE